MRLKPVGCEVARSFVVLSYPDATLSVNQDSAPDKEPFPDLCEDQTFIIIIIFFSGGKSVSVSEYEYLFRQVHC